jgi:hypothetical protein
VQAKKRKYGHDHHDQTNQIDQTIHLKTSYRLTYAAKATPLSKGKFRQFRLLRIQKLVPAFDGNPNRFALRQKGLCQHCSTLILKDWLRAASAWIFEF